MLDRDGYRPNVGIILVNSNPATIMTDPDLAHATYIEPITPEIVAKIIEKERAERPKEAQDPVLAQNAGPLFFVVNSG